MKIHTMVFWITGMWFGGRWLSKFCINIPPSTSGWTDCLYIRV